MTYLLSSISYNQLILFVQTYNLSTKEVTQGKLCNLIKTQQSETVVALHQVQQKMPRRSGQP